MVDLAARLDRELGVPTTRCGELVRVDPHGEEGVLAALALARAERWGVVPVGSAAHLTAFPFATRTAFALGTRNLAGIVAYEPGDGTITARAGTTIEELSARVAVDGYAFTPDVSRVGAPTLGGVIAAGRSGVDRELRGPVRHHVLGLRVALADGRVVKSGGRLVKNVTGYDLHRLHCGARGTLGVILEASLRLFPAPQTRRLLRASCANLAEALRIASLPREHRLRALTSRAATEPDGSAYATIELAGLAEQADADERKLRALVPTLEARPQAESTALRDRPTAPFAVAFGTSPSRVAALASTLDREVRASSSAAAIEAFPAVATIILRADEFLPFLQIHARNPEASVHPIACPSDFAESLLPEPPPIARLLMHRLRAELDPLGTFGVVRALPLL